MKSHLLILGSLSYALLAVLALVFYLERTAFLDISFHLFYLLKDGTFAIQNNRFGSFFTQAIPLIGSKMGLSLQSIMQTYSVGFVFYYFVLFLLTILWNKSYQYGIIMLLFSTLMVTDTFYWIQSELPQGLAFLIFFFSFITYVHQQNHAQRSWFWPINSMLLLFLVFFHPLMIIPFFFILVFLYLDGAIDKMLLKSIGATFLIFFILKNLFFKTTYDSKSIGGIKNFLTLFPDYFFLPSNKKFLLYLLKDYYFLLLSFVAVLVFYLKTKNYPKLLLVATTFLAYTLLVNVSYMDGGEQFYMENLYLPLSIFVIFPLVLDLSKHLKQQHLLIALVLIVMVRIVHIYSNHTIYSERIDYLTELLEQTAKNDPKKLIIDEKDISKDRLMMTWASPYEFWLLSTIQTGETRSMMITDAPKSLEWTFIHKRKFVTKWGVFDHAELPSNYFSLQDTSFYRFKSY